MSRRPEFFPARELFDRLVAEQKERPNRIGIAWLFAEREAMLETAKTTGELLAAASSIGEAIDREGAMMKEVGTITADVSGKFEDVVSHVGKVSDAITDNSNTMKEQTSATQSIALSMERLSQTSEANLESVKQACAVSNSVSDGVSTLDACVSNFKT